MDEPAVKWLCEPCGRAARQISHIQKFHKPPKDLQRSDETDWYIGTCDLCNEEERVTDLRHFYYPNIEDVYKIIGGKTRTRGFFKQNKQKIPNLQTNETKKTSSSQSSIFATNV